MKNRLAMAFFLVAAAGFASALIGQGYDGNAPVISITSPTEGQSFAAGTTSITMLYSATDIGGGSIAKYWVKADSGSWVDNALSTSYSFTGLSSGSHTFYAIATDDSDNNSTTASVSAAISSGTAVCGNGTCDSGETTISCPADCPPSSQTCSSKGGTICSSNQACAGSITTASDTSDCCIGGCTQKSCVQSGGVFCDINSNDCSTWINQSTSCCLAGNCTPKATQTILCSFPTYLETEPVVAAFVETAKLEKNYAFNVAGATIRISPDASNTLSDTIVLQYPDLKLVSANLIDSPSITPEQAYLLELLKKNSLFGSSAYTAGIENYQNIYTLMDSSRIRWWNPSEDDSCEPKLSPSEIGVSLQTMHYFRINNLWLLWHEKTALPSGSAAAKQSADPCANVICNDSNPCTLDACVKGSCVFNNAAQNTKCAGGFCINGKCVKTGKK